MKRFIVAMALAAVALAGCGGKDAASEPPPEAAAHRTAPQPAAAMATPRSTFGCMQDALAAAPFTGTHAQRLRQARSQRPETRVLIRGQWRPLGPRGSIWKHCEAPGAAADTTAAAEIARLRAVAYVNPGEADPAKRYSYKDQVTALRTLAYVDPTDPESQTYQARVTELERTLDASSGPSWLTVWVLVLMALAVGAALTWMLANRGPRKPRRRAPETIGSGGPRTSSAMPDDGGSTLFD